MGNLIIASLIFVALMIPFALIGYYLRKKWDESCENRANNPVEKQTAICPYCGHMQTKFWEVRNPAFWTCGECHRVWGDESRMTEEERHKKWLTDIQCYNVENCLPNLQEIINVVSERSGASEGTVFLRNGYVWYYGGSVMEKIVIARYCEETVPTKVGRTHVAKLCLDHCRRKHSDLTHFRFHGWLTDDGGFAWEWLENK